MMAFLGAIIRASLRHRPVVLIAAVLFVLVGLRSTYSLHIDAMPDITNVQVQVITAAPALSPVEVEQYVTIPVERAMAGIPRTTEIRSISKYGLSVVTVVFRDDVDIYFARQLVAERMREAADRVSAQHGKPEMGPITSALGEIYRFAVRNDGMSLMQLEEVLDWQIAPALRTVPGIVEVNSLGGEDRQYQVVLDPKRLLATGISVAQVIDAMRRSNANAGGGYVEHNQEQIVVGSEGLVKNIDDVRSVVVAATPQGVPITIATVGDVRFGPRLRRGAATRDGEGEVAIGVAMMLIGENSLTVTSAVKAKLAAIESSLPKGTRIEPFYDRSVLVNRTIGTVGQNLLIGAALVIGVLFMMLGDVRAGIVVALTIPLSMLFAMVLMNLLGMSGNLMSLGAVDFGLIVDGAVIVVENAARRLGEAQEGAHAPLDDEHRVRIIEEAALEVRSASIFGELIIAIVYLPILTLTAVEGKLFRPMATTVLFALLGAFVMSLTVIPVLTSYLVKPKRGHRETWLLRQVHRGFVPVLRVALRHRWATLGATAALLAVTVLVATGLGAEFVPQLDEGDGLIEARRLPGVSLNESVQTSLRLERALRAIPEVSHVVSLTGAPEIATDPMGVEQSDVYIGLKDRTGWRGGLTKTELEEELATAMGRDVPELTGAVSQPIQMRTNELLAGVKSDVAVVLYGRDLDELAKLGESVSASLKGVQGAVDVRVQQVSGLRYLRVVPERKKLARYGLTIEDVNQLTETIAVGHHVGEVLEGERRFGLVVKTAHGFDGDLESMRALPLKSITGQIVPLGDVADISFAMGPSQVSRSKQSRKLTVEFNVRGRDMLSVVNDAQQKVGRDLTLPMGYRVEWGGQFEHYTEANARLSVVVPMALALIVFMLWLAFGSRRLAILIFLNVPFAVIGGVFSLWIRGIPFSISAGIGFIALFGVAVLNGLVLVSFARHLEERGTEHVEAIRRTAEQRLRPVLTTALVASLGFVPMALSTHPGAEVQRPLATVVIGGLITSTFLTLVVLPVVYAWLAKPPARGGASSLRAIPAAPRVPEDI
jgi:cobalt-zinc-cadmium resistance protein CzcA